MLSNMRGLKNLRLKLLRKKSKKFIPLVMMAGGNFVSCDRIMKNLRKQEVDEDAKLRL